MGAIVVLTRDARCLTTRGEIGEGRRGGVRVIKMAWLGGIWEMQKLQGPVAKAEEEKGGGRGWDFWKFRRRLERNGGREPKSDTAIGDGCQSLSERSGCAAQFPERYG
jgi:hypothetical protein